MNRSGGFTKKSLLIRCQEGVRQFLERRFDWIVLVVITLIILVTLVYF